ncbi:MAG: LysR family transcriptional regulator [Clostridia bacterium]|nr:LysR family transcriptional regulator [Clostridia bacterium]
MVSNLSLYRIFLETARSGSISAAARRLYVTQPAVSVGIIQLESELGVKLFFRTSKGIKLTQEGETLYEYVANAMNFLESGEDKLRELNNLDGGVLRVGASDMTLKFYLLDYLERFHREHPRVRLTVSNNPTPSTVEELKNGIIDFCVISEPSREDDEIVYERVKKIRDIIVCSPEKLASLPKGPQKLSELLSLQTFVMLDRGTSTRKYQESWMKRCGVDEDHLQPDIELATSDLVVEFAKRGMGIGCVVEEFAKEDIAAGRLVEIPLAEPFPPRWFMLAYLKKMPLSSGTKQFLELLGKAEG